MFMLRRSFIIVFAYLLCQTMFAQQVSLYTDSEIDLLLKEIDLPLIEVWTVNGQEPKGEHISAPEGYWGITLVNNDYLSGRMKIFRKGELLYDSNELGMKIKLRGNTSGLGEKKPYKIKLQKSEDLLFRGNSIYKDKDWVLLRVYGKFPARAFTGLKVGKLVGLEWEPSWEYVNLVINGEYKGDYLLIEAVEREDGRINIDKTGYLIEDDAYWWSEDVYFKGNFLQDEVGFTFKYPDTEDLNDSIISNIKNFILDFEYALKNKDDVSKYIDMQNWAAWLLAQDILGQKDSGGTNRYIYKKDYDEANPYSTQLKMGPLWDFDGSLVRDNTWGGIHNVEYSFYYTELLKRSDFLDLYYFLWDSIKVTLLDELAQYYETLIRTKGEWINKCRKLNKEIYSYDSGDTLQQELQFAYNWMEKRVDWINQQMKTTDIEDVCGAVNEFYDLQGRKVENPVKGIYIVNGKKVVIK